MEHVVIYDFLGKRWIEIPQDFDIVAKEVFLVPDEGFVRVIPADVEGEEVLRKLLADAMRAFSREDRLCDRDLDPTEIKAAGADDSSHRPPDLPDIVPEVEGTGTTGEYRDGYEHLPDDPLDDDLDGPTWSAPWPPQDASAPPPPKQTGKTRSGRSLGTVRPRHIIRFLDLRGHRIGFGLWNGTVSLAFPWVCETEAEAVAARTELDPKDWRVAASRCQHGRTPAVAYRDLPKPIYWATTYCPEWGFHDERDPLDSLGIRGYAVFRLGAPPSIWDKPIDY